MIIGVRSRSEARECELLPTETVYGFRARDDDWRVGLKAEGRTEPAFGKSAALTPPMRLDTRDDEFDVRRPADSVENVRETLQFRIRNDGIVETDPAGFAFENDILVDLVTQ